MMKKYCKQFTAAQLAEFAGGKLFGDGSIVIDSAAPFETACKNNITFASDNNLLKNIANCKAGVVLTSKEVKSEAAVIVVDSVEKSLLAVLEKFMPSLSPAKSGIDKTAVVASDAQIDSSASIGAFVSIKSGAVIGAGTVISDGCRIGQDVVIGKNCRIDENTVIYHNCQIGNNCIISANCTIGAAGFGYYFIDGSHRHIPHTGGVVIEDCVELGANVCVDRSKFGNTIIGAGTKVDNLVQIAHNVVIGKCCLIVAQVGIAGSSRLGSGVVLAGQVGIKDHINVGDGAQIGAQAGVMTNIDAGSRVAGSPAIDIKEKVRQILLTQKLPEMNKELKELSKRIENIETAKDNS